MHSRGIATDACVSRSIIALPQRSTVFADVLNRLAPVKLLANGDIPSKENIVGRDARHVLKHIFPRQFGLKHPFDATQGPSSNGFKGEDYSALEEEIQVSTSHFVFLGDINDQGLCKMKGNVKTPIRLKPALDLVQGLIRRHWACNYRAIRSTICPSKVL